MKRDLYVVCLSPEGPRAWKLTRNGEFYSDHDTQAAAIETCMQVCKSRLEAIGKTAEMKIMGKDGQPAWICFCSRMSPLVPEYPSLPM